MKYSIIISVFLSVFVSAGVLKKGTKIFAKPATSSKVLHVLKINMKLTLKKINNNWYKVVNNKKYEGYVTFTNSSSNSKASSRSKKSDSHSTSNNINSSKGNSNDITSGKTGSAGNSKSSKVNKSSRPSKNNQSSNKNASRKLEDTPKPRKMSRAEQVKMQHDAAKAAAEANNEEFCSQCWYAQNGHDGRRFENTHPEIKGGVIVPDSGFGGSGETTIVK